MSRRYNSTNKIKRALTFGGAAFLAMALNASPSLAACPAVTFAQLQTALQNAVAAGNGGLGFNMWATIVDRDGTVCLVAKSGAAGTQWPGSRVISAQKANTANAFSLPNFALSTANLFSATQPGGSLFGLQESNPVDADVAYVGSAATWGTPGDNLVTKKIGGINVFGGGLALYNGGLVGGLGVSGDTSCADHNIAWRVRKTLGLDHVPAGVAPAGNDGIIYDVTGSHGNFESKSGFGHPTCGGTEQSVAKSIGAGG
jgi:uncharacterized protein GlcG (DUF336 family)